tara:strand:+ start:334 stop:969 length:636 start_codon:yes stop_codon:yes gene_type:complete
MTKTFLDKIYAPDFGTSASDLYQLWAPSYDNELRSSKYVTPTRCAKMLFKYCSNTNIEILDFGCGSGLSGEALYQVGFRKIDGLDLSTEMLKLARQKDIYNELSDNTLNSLINQGRKYDAIIAAGVISPGHAPPETIELALSLLKPKGILVFSLNDHALDNRSFIKKIEHITLNSLIDILEQEYGDHIIKLELKAKVFAIRIKSKNAYTNW